MDIGLGSGLNKIPPPKDQKRERTFDKLQDFLEMRAFISIRVPADKDEGLLLRNEIRERRQFLH